MRMPDPTLQTGSNAEVLIGRLAEYQELLDTLGQRPGLTVIAADPLSGMSALLASVLEELHGSQVLADARSCADGLDLAMAVADAAVERLAPEAMAWWTRAAPPSSVAGLRLSRALSERGIDLEALRLGTGPAERRLPEALELLLALADGDAMLVIDHLGPMLSALPIEEARQLLDVLRAARQEHRGLDLVLVEYPDGPMASALADQGHPLYRAGQVMRLRRAKPSRFTGDMAIARPWTEAPVELVGAAAELASGVPELTWRTIDLAPVDGEEVHARALAGWRKLRRLTAISTVRQWELLRRVHPLAQSVVAATGAGLRPHAVAANPKSINDALVRLRELGVAWQPEPRRWALADPLLAAWVRDYPPPWVKRRRPFG